MKFDDLRAVGHNLADSLASGASLLTGCYELDVFAEARRTPAGMVDVDFLTGACSEAASPKLSHACLRFAAALPALCAKHRIFPAAIRTLRGRFFADGCRFSVTVENRAGRRAEDVYAGIPGRRAKCLDPLGRVRKQAGRVTPAGG